MIPYLKGLVTGKLHRSVLVKNYLYLSMYQVINFLAPIIIIPHIVKVLGIEKYGSVVFSYAFVTYFAIFTDYGFNLSATRDISISRDDEVAVNHIFNRVIQSKLLLYCIAFILFTVIVYIIPVFRKELLLHYCSFILVLTQTLLPIWFFQGLEDMRFIAMLNAISKLCFIGLIFIIVRTPEHYILVNLLQGLGGLFSCVICYILIKKKYNISYVRIPIKEIFKEIKDGTSLFISGFAVSVYVNSNTFLLGMFANRMTLGYYGIAEKVVLAVKQLLIVFSQVVYPYMCKITNEPFDKTRRFLKTAFIPFAYIIIASCICIFLFSDYIVLYAIKGKNVELSNLLKLFSFLPIIVLFDIPAYQVLLAYNLRKAYSTILISGCVLNILINFVLSYYFKAWGTVTSVLITELYITFGLNILLHVKYPQYSLLKRINK
ncbi:oligosaccharide flippase family protein [Chitinophaga eiseniae]|uniref:Oligosaccharide flippase family protein n=1 Tax=Chitinophaga eiseniae TaxID=634771 RepID=A0A847SFS8_9BACT|nr:oligosaccharide flippase family protein [Chitinophaga eiseniae]NLR78613.1 oligosaccharide flippase family protein [Chitinophaga eiseniae]